MKLPMLALCAGLLMLAGCSAHVRTSQDVRLERDATWLVLPLVNRTTTPQAGLRAQAIGLCALIAGVNGFGWQRRLLLLAPGMRPQVHAARHGAILHTA